jgi:hypothetical protein
MFARDADGLIGRLGPRDGPVRLRHAVRAIADGGSRAVGALRIGRRATRDLFGLSRVRDLVGVAADAVPDRCLVQVPGHVLVPQLEARARSHRRCTPGCRCLRRTAPRPCCLRRFHPWGSPSRPRRAGRCSRHARSAPDPRRCSGRAGRSRCGRQISAVGRVLDDVRVDGVDCAPTEEDLEVAVHWNHDRSVSILDLPSSDLYLLSRRHRRHGRDACAQHCHDDRQRLLHDGPSLGAIPA